MVAVTACPLTNLRSAKRAFLVTATLRHRPIHQSLHHRRANPPAFRNPRLLPPFSARPTLSLWLLVSTRLVPQANISPISASQQMPLTKCLPERRFHSTPICSLQSRSRGRRAQPRAIRLLCLTRLTLPRVQTPCRRRFKCLRRMRCVDLSHSTARCSRQSSSASLQLPHLALNLEMNQRHSLCRAHWPVPCPSQPISKRLPFPIESRPCSRIHSAMR